MLKKIYVILKGVWEISKIENINLHRFALNGIKIYVITVEKKTLRIIYARNVAAFGKMYTTINFDLTSLNPNVKSEYIFFLHDFLPTLMTDWACTFTVWYCTYILYVGLHKVPFILFSLFSCYICSCIPWLISDYLWIDWSVQWQTDVQADAHFLLYLFMYSLKP